MLLRIFGVFGKIVNFLTFIRIAFPLTLSLLGASTAERSVFISLVGVDHSLRSVHSSPSCAALRKCNVCPSQTDFSRKIVVKRFTLDHTFPDSHVASGTEDATEKPWTAPVSALGWSLP